MLMPPPPQEGWVSHSSLRLPVMIQQQKNIEAEEKPCSLPQMP